MVNNGKVFGEYLDVYISIEGSRTGAPVTPKYDRSSSKYARKPQIKDYGGGDVTFSQWVSALSSFLDSFIDA